MAPQLCPREIRWLANGTQLQICQSPLPLLDKHQRDAKLPRDAVATIGRFLGETANQDGCLVVGAHLDLIQGVSGVFQVTGLVSREPLLLRQQEAKRPYANKIVRQYVLYSLCLSFLSKLKVSSPQAIIMHCMFSLLVSVPSRPSQPRLVCSEVCDGWKDLSTDDL